MTPENERILRMLRQAQISSFIHNERILQDDHNAKNPIQKAGQRIVIQKRVEDSSIQNE